jgi:hypothetical protein
MKWLITMISGRLQFENRLGDLHRSAGTTIGGKIDDLSAISPF